LRVKFDAARELDAKVLTRPALLVTDSASAVYAGRARSERDRRFGD